MSSSLRPRTAALILSAVFLMALAARMCQIGILWAEESYPTAAAMQLLQGKVLYRDIWFDKPPLYAIIYLLWDAQPGFALRWAGALYLVLAASLAYRFALDLWGRDEALLAGGLLALYLTFGIPSAVMALAPDLLLVAPQLAAVYLAWRGWPFWAGFFAGLGFAANAKGILLLPVCLLWQWRKTPRLLAGFLLPNVVLGLYLADNRAWSAYWREAWDWNFAYARDTFLEHPVSEGIVRTANWAGFQATAVLGAIAYFWRDRSPERRRFAIWLAIAFVSVCAGWRFFPRYYFLPLAGMCVVGARGLLLMPARWRIVALALLLIPVVRFGPRSVALGRDLIGGTPHTWSDLAMEQDSRRAADIVRHHAKPGDTLLVWGYRSELYPFTGLLAGTRFLDSQPLTGVLADRHLTDARPTLPQVAEQNRRELIQTSPAFIVDGLGPYQPRLSIHAFPDLTQWLNGYQEIGRTPGSVIYRRKAASTLRRIDSAASGT